MASSAQHHAAHRPAVRQDGQALHTVGLSGHVKGAVGSLHRQKSWQPQGEGQQQDIAPCNDAFPPHHAPSAGAGRQQGVHAALPFPGEAAEQQQGNG